jgi:hypothetical protein
MSEERDGCHVVHASDGTPVRVQGSIDQGSLDALLASVRAELASMCKHEGPHEMPDLAQKIHGRRTYWCGLPGGHDGLHEWGQQSWAGGSGE